ncbi:hypothetical protein [Actomonas aquatica]|uniref:Uncharacterized protein n=1 Tax=Actomonas aquatica TaxID=2866162 RepID=A0ABZ1CBB2_9BACT|nr:hypothetical protein [Opitutus sp. WL0086]WRQ88979.1 hypothetical protein K1X11_006140 [Opitutus sp. WL0086]
MNDRSGRGLRHDFRRENGSGKNRSDSAKERLARSWLAHGFKSGHGQPVKEPVEFSKVKQNFSSKWSDPNY